MAASRWYIYQYCYCYRHLKFLYNMTVFVSRVSCYKYCKHNVYRSLWYIICAVHCGTWPGLWFSVRFCVVVEDRTGYIITHVCTFVGFTICAGFDGFFGIIHCASCMIGLFSPHINDWQRAHDCVIGTCRNKGRILCYRVTVCGCFLSVHIVHVRVCHQWQLLSVLRLKPISFQVFCTKKHQK